MMFPRPGIQPGFREVAIVVDAETGVAGKVTPGDHVDIIATIEGDDDTPNRAELWASDVLVLDVGLPQDIEETDQAGNFSRGTGVPVTFALEAPDAVRLAYIESFSVKLRLGVREIPTEFPIKRASSPVHPKHKVTTVGTVTTNGD